MLYSEFIQLMLMVMRKLMMITMITTVTHADNDMTAVQTIGPSIQSAMMNLFPGSKKYLMGDQPCEQDCAIFGQLSQLYWQLPGPTGVMFKGVCEFHAGKYFISNLLGFANVIVR